MEEEVKTIGDYWLIAKRRKYLFVIPFVLLMAVTVVIALVLPAVYRSEGVILVESQQIPSDLIRSTVTSYAEERIQVIKQRVMTRDNLLEIAKKYKTMGVKGKSSLVTEIVEDIESRISIELVSVGGNKDRRKKNTTQTLAFTVAFEHEIPTVAQQVSNALVTLFLDENLKARTERATETTDFITKEADKLKAEIEAIEDQIAEYKEQNKDSLPEHLDLNMKALERAQLALSEIDREIKSQREQRTYLDVELTSQKSMMPSVQANEVLTPAQKLILLKENYSQLSAVYGPAHPDIKKVKREISILEDEVGKSGDGTPESGAVVEEVNPTIMLLEARIAASNSNIASLNALKIKQLKKLEMLEERVIKTPQVERGFKALGRDYENLQKKYAGLRTKQTEAQLSQSMEEQSKAERFSLLEPPVLPEKPIRPDRAKIILLGFFLSVGGAFGLVLLAEGVDHSIRGSRHLARIVKEMPLVSIPYIINQKDINRRRRIRLYILLAIVLLIAAALVLGHFYYKPLDMIWYKLLRLSGLQ
ncbi:MAG: lipopolysaccharide biosynthesis protein [Candidatus Sedimenticola sp. (ex Thyasira tokunagai)]